jgi:hypothetical protein
MIRTRARPDEVKHRGRPVMVTGLWFTLVHGRNAGAKTRAGTASSYGGA